MAKRLIGYGNTNSSGVATITNAPDGSSISGYTGVGAGKIDIVAELHDDSSVQSEPYQVLDCIYIDNCKSDDHANWNNTNGFTWADGKCTITVSSSSFPRVATAISGDFEATLKASMSDSIRLTAYNSANPNQQRSYVMNSANEQYYRINRVNGVWTAQTSTDGETWTNLTLVSGSSALSTESVWVGFVISTSSQRSITYSDLMVYPI